MFNENMDITFDAEVEKIFKAKPTFLVIWCSLLFFIIMVLISALLWGFSFSQKQIFQIRIKALKSIGDSEIPILERSENFMVMLKMDYSRNEIIGADKAMDNNLAIIGSADISKIIRNGSVKRSVKILIDEDKLGRLGWLKGNEITLIPTPTDGLKKFTATLNPDVYKLLEQCFYNNINTELEIELKEKNFYAYIVEKK